MLCMIDIFSKGGGDPVNFAENILREISDSIDLKKVVVKPSCIVCSRVAFSDSLYEADRKLETEKNSGFLKNIDFNNFMSTQLVGNTGKTYTSIFTGGSGAGYSAIAQKEVSENKPLGSTEASSSSQLAIIFAQIKVSGVDPTNQFWNTLKAGGIAGGIAAVSSPGSIFSLPVALFKVITVGAVSTYLAYDSEAATKENQAISHYVCGDFESQNSEQQRGCSLVKLMNWNVNDVNSLCTGGIEGNL